MLLSIYSCCHFVSLIAQVPSPAIRACCSFLCVQLDVAGLALPQLCLAASETRQYMGRFLSSTLASSCTDPLSCTDSYGGNSTLQNHLEVSVGLGTDVPCSLSTMQLGRSHSLILYGSWALGYQLVFPLESGKCGETEINKSIHPSIQNSSVAGITGNIPIVHVE